MFGNIKTKLKVADTYLGDMVHTEGLAASVAATVSDRASKVKAAMYEAAAIIEDYRMQAVGGLMGAWDLWNMAIIPSLLNNCGVWTEIDEKTVQRLEDLQNTYVRRVLHVPLSTPKVSLRSETGLLSIKHRIWEEKIRMIMAMKEMGPNFLARKVYEEQLR